MPESWREMKMVMIPKPGKDHTAVKGWWPIVLANVVRKLAENGAGTGLVGERGSWQQYAAVHRHSLDRLNTINDSPPQKKKVSRGGR